MFRAPRDFLGYLFTTQGAHELTGPQPGQIGWPLSRLRREGHEVEASFRNYRTAIETPLKVSLSSRRGARNLSWYVSHELFLSWYINHKRAILISPNWAEKTNLWHAYFETISTQMGIKSRLRAAAIQHLAVRNSGTFHVIADAGVVSIYLYSV